jgi:hypothetical protein
MKSADPIDLIFALIVEELKVSPPESHLRNQGEILLLR